MSNAHVVSRVAPSVAVAWGMLALVFAPACLGAAPDEGRARPQADASADVGRGNSDAPPAPAAPVGKASPGSESALSAGTADDCVQKGRELLAQNKYQGALDQFLDAIKKDRNNPDAYHGAGLCYQNMGQRQLALDELEKAVTLYDPPSRAAVFNCAGANLRGNPMRAFKLIRDYVSRDGVPPDEQLHTLMGKALFSVDRQGRQNKAYAEALQFYFGYTENVDATRHDGRKRWGAEWVPAKDANDKWDRFRKRQENVERLHAVVDRATKKKKDEWDRLYDLRNGLRLKGTQEMKDAEKRYDQAARAEIAARQQLQAAETEFNSTEKPPFPQLVKPLPMDPPAPPSPGKVAK